MKFVKELLLNFQSICDLSKKRKSSSHPRYHEIRRKAIGVVQLLAKVFSISAVLHSNRLATRAFSSDLSDLDDPES